MIDTNLEFLEVCFNDSRVLCVSNSEGKNVTGYLVRLCDLNMLDMVFLDESEWSGNLLDDLVKGGIDVPIYTAHHRSLSPWRLDVQVLI